MKVRIMMAGLAVAMMSTAPQGRAQDPGSGRVSFTNNSSHAIWVTIYRDPGRGRNIVHGCVPGGGGYFVQNTGAAAAHWSGYYLLTEVKADKTSCSNGSNVSVIEANQKMSNSFVTYVDAGTNKVRLQ